jgi:hypothetical protein
MRFVLIAISIFVFLNGNAQKYLDGENFRFGVKIGTSFSTLIGDELENPKPRFGYLAGIYYKQKIGNKIGIYSEFTGNVRGSNFSNGIDGYSGIHLFSLELPVAFAIDIKEDKTISLGPQVSYYPASSLFVGDNRKTEIDGLGFKPFDLKAVIYYTKSYDIISLHTGFKFGLRNINQNIDFGDRIKPATGNGGLIRLICLDFALIF